MSISSPLSPSGCMSRSLEKYQCQYSQGQLFLLLTPFPWDSTFTPIVTTLHFFATFSSLLINSLFRVFIFAKRHLTYQRATRSQPNSMLCCLCVNFWQMHSDQSLTDSEGREGIGHWSWGTSRYAQVYLWTKALAAKFYFI